MIKSPITLISTPGEKLAVNSPSNISLNKNKDKSPSQISTEYSPDSAYSSNSCNSPPKIINDIHSSNDHQNHKVYKNFTESKYLHFFIF